MALPWCSDSRIGVQVDLPGQIDTPDIHKHENGGCPEHIGNIFLLLHDLPLTPTLSRREFSPFSLREKGWG